MKPSAEVLLAIQQLSRLTQLFQKRRAQLAKRAGVTEQQWHTLEQISASDFMPSMFARDEDSTPGAVSKLLRQLLDKGLIKVSISTHDARQRNYELTAAGRRVIKSVEEYRNDAIRKVWSRLNPDQLRQFTAFNQELIANLERYSREEE